MLGYSSKVTRMMQPPFIGLPTHKVLLEVKWEGESMRHIQKYSSVRNGMMVCCDNSGATARNTQGDKSYIARAASVIVGCNRDLLRDFGGAEILSVKPWERLQDKFDLFRLQNSKVSTHIRLYETAS